MRESHADPFATLMPVFAQMPTSVLTYVTYLTYLTDPTTDGALRLQCAP